MSKSMNKCHKCIQELGKLPGWVKLGAVALAVGVGIGGWSPGGGMSKAWAGKYRVTIALPQSKKEGACVAFKTEDVDEGLVDFFAYYGRSNGSIAIAGTPKRTIVKNFHCGTRQFSFDIGGVSIRRKCNEDIVSFQLSGGAQNNSLYIVAQSPINLSIEKGESLIGDSLIFDGIHECNVDGTLSCGSLVALLNCPRFWLRSGGSLKTKELAIISDVLFGNYGYVQCSSMSVVNAVFAAYASGAILEIKGDVSSSSSLACDPWSDLFLKEDIRDVDCWLDGREMPKCRDEECFASEFALPCKEGAGCHELVFVLIIKCDVRGTHPGGKLLVSLKDSDGVKVSEQACNFPGRALAFFIRKTVKGKLTVEARGSEGSLENVFGVRANAFCY